MKSSRWMRVHLAKISQFFSRANRRTLLVSCALIVVMLVYTIFREGGILGTLRLRQTHAKIEFECLSRCFWFHRVLW